MGSGRARRQHRPDSRLEPRRDTLATLDSVANQTYDLLVAMAAGGLRPETLKVDGVTAQNPLFMQRLADILGMTIRRPANNESAAFDAACLAGLGRGMYRSAQDLAALSRTETRFEPRMPATERDQRIASWREALQRVRSH